MPLCMKVSLWLVGLPGNGWRMAESMFLTTSHKRLLTGAIMLRTPSLTVDKTDRATADMALNGIQTLTAILMQREVDTECEGPGLLVLSAPVACGLLEAVASCARLVELTIDRGAQA